MYSIFMIMQGRKVERHYEYMNVMLIILFIASKFMIKRVSRTIDYYRNYYIHTDDTMASLTNAIPISLEFTLEFWVSALYWSVQRQYIVFDVPSTSQYVLVILLHLSAEGIVSVIRSSQRYFVYSGKFLERYKDRHIGCKVVDRIWSTDSTYKQWKLRCLSEMMLRFIAATTMGLTQGVFLFV